MLLSSVSVRARRALGAGIIAVVIGSAVASVAGPAQAVVTPVFSVSATAGAPGDKLTLSGTGCLSAGNHQGDVYAYQGAKSVPVGAPPTTDLLLTGSTVVAIDGTWTITVDVPQTSGVITWVANCGTTQAGTPIFWYGQVGTFTVSADTTTTTEPVVTTTTEPAVTTTVDPASPTTVAASATTAAPAAKASAVTANPAFTG